tara:strand:+ start:81 stop:335 length:255 start_codon:yes stop_codon:yes gene_type:complete
MNGKLSIQEFVILLGVASMTVLVWYMRRARNKDIKADLGEDIHALESHVHTELERVKKHIERLYEEDKRQSDLLGRLDERSTHR